MTCRAPELQQPLGTRPWALETCHEGSHGNRRKRWGRAGGRRDRAGRGARGSAGGGGTGTCDVLAQLVVLLAQRPQQLEDAVLLHQGQLVLRVVVDEVAHGASGVALHLLVGVVEELHQSGHSLEAAGLQAQACVSARACALCRCAQACGGVWVCAEV